MSLLLPFFLATLASLALTPMVRVLAWRHGWLDRPGLRKVHGRPVPRVGGLAVAMGFFAAIGAAMLIGVPLDLDGRLVALLGGALAMLALGLADDLRGLSAGFRLLVQVGVAAGAWGLGLQIQEFTDPLGGTWALGVLSLPLTVLWIVLVTNAVNLLDGLDGLACGTSLIAVATLLAVGLLHDRPLMVLTCLALAGALLGFLRYNFAPASIFLGDGGSLFIGYLLATASLASVAKASALVSVAVPLLVLALPLADTALAVSRRLAAGRSPLQADRQHLHHRLLDGGFSHRQAVLLLYGVCALLTGAALAHALARDVLSGALLLAGGLATAYVARRRPSAPLEGVERPVTAVAVVDHRHAPVALEARAEAVVAAEVDVEVRRHVG